MEKWGEPLLIKAVGEALKGDMPTLRLLLSYILHAPKDLPASTGPLRVGTPEELMQTFQGIWQRVSSGQLAPIDAQRITTGLEQRRRFLETEELAQEVAELERMSREDEQAA